MLYIIVYFFQEKKEQEERERRKRLEEGEKESENHSRNVEAQMFAKILADKNLEIYEVSEIYFAG